MDNAQQPIAAPQPVDACESQAPAKGRKAPRRAAKAAAVPAQAIETLRPEPDKSESAPPDPVKASGDAPSPTPVRQPATAGGGRRATAPLVKRLLLDATPAAAQMLIDMIQDPDMNPRIRCQAAEILFNRVYGRSAQPMDAAAAGKGETVVVKFTGVLEEWAK